MVQQMTTDPRKLNFAARVEIMRMQNGGIIDQPTAERLFTALGDKPTPETLPTESLIAYGVRRGLSLIHI